MCRISSPLLLCFLILLTGTLFFFIYQGVVSTQERKNHPFQSKIEVMGTYASVAFWGEPQTLEKASEAIFFLFGQLDEQLSTYKPGSELSRLNATAHQQAVVCSDRLWQLLLIAREAHHVSEGAFDITVGPLMRLWGFYRKQEQIPSHGEIMETLKRVGLNKVRFNEHKKTVFFTERGMALDLGAFVKGYAVDEAVKIAKRFGIQRGIIDLGGNLYCLEKPPPEKEAYRIAIRDPHQRSANFAYAKLLQQGIATSGDYERMVVLDGKRFAHIMDPRTGCPVESIASVSVVSSSAMQADIYSTTIFVDKGKYIRRYRANYPDLAILLIHRQKNGKLIEEYVGNCWERRDGFIE